MYGDCMYKLQRKKLKVLIKGIMKENNVKKEDIIIPIAGIGVVTLLWATSLIAIDHGIAKPVYENSNRSYSKEKIIVSNVTNEFEDIIDLENYNLETIAKLDENYGSLYEQNDVTLYCNKYSNIVHEKAAKWGIDENLLLAILTEESRQGNVLNLMQIDFDVWKNVPFKVYDFENEKYVDILLTDDLEKYNDSRYITINRSDLDNPETNISIGAAIFQDSLIKMNYHIPAAIQCYNYGVAKMNDDVFPNMEQDSFKRKTDVLSDQYDFSFMNNTIPGYGDSIYLYNVARFINPNVSVLSVIRHTENGNEEVRFDMKKLIDNYHKYQENNLGNKI